MPQEHSKAAHATESLLGSSEESIKGIFSINSVWKLSVLAFMAANLYLQQNFTTKAQFEHLDDRTRKIEMVLSQLELKNQVDLTQTEALNALDGRVRDLEKQISLLNGKLGNITK